MVPMSRLLHSTTVQKCRPIMHTYRTLTRCRNRPAAPDWDAGPRLPWRALPCPRLPRLLKGELGCVVNELKLLQRAGVPLLR